jgi:class 3 adenylate cyclase/tetratricopeptide (TPR) repeat protein
MNTPGSATSTILFTDLVNSTELMQREGDEDAQHIFRAHHRLLSECAARHGGHEVSWLGDGLMVVFASAADAARCAIAMQQGSRRPAAGHRLAIRAGLHCGEALREGANYFGSAIVVARRLCDSAAGSEILASGLVAQLLAGAREFRFEERGALRLKGIAEPVPAAALLYEHDAAGMLAHTPFVGRGEETAILRRRLDEAGKGSASVVMLAGEPGIGKTRLVEEFAEHARAVGALVLWGRCYDGGWAPPFSPFVEGLRQYARDTQPGDIPAEAKPHAAVLARIAPELRDAVPDAPAPPDLPPEAERFRLLEATSAFLRTVSERQPVVLVLDDLHWADAGTVAMLRDAARATRAERVLIVGTYRDVEVDDTHPLSGALVDMRRETQLQRIAVGGLGADDVGMLLDVVAEQDVPAAFVAALTEETSGNPFFIREVLLHLVETGAIARDGGRWEGQVPIAETGIPESVREVIARRLGRLSDAARGVLTVASEFSSGFTFEEIAAVLPHVRATAGLAIGVEDAKLLDSFDEALGAQLIVSAGRGAYDFPHALVRHTLYDALSEPRRVRLHAAVADGLEAHAGPRADAMPEKLAGRYAEAAPLSAAYAAKALHYSRLAAEQAEAQFAFDVAARHYGRCVELLQSSSQEDTAAEAALLQALGRALRNTGEYRQAWRTFWHAIQRFDAAGDRMGLARTALEALEIDVPPDRFVPLLERALEAVGDRDLHLRAQLLTLWLTAPTVVSTVTAERVTAIRAQVEELAAGHDFDDVKAQMVLMDARRAVFTGEFDTAWELFERARRDFEQLGLVKDVSKVMYARSTAMEGSGDLAKAQEVAEANLDWVRRHHMRYEEVHIAACLASVLLLRCDFDGFDAHTRDRANDFTIVTPSLLATRAEMACDFDEAMSHLDVAVAGRVPGYLAHMHGVRARVLLNAGRNAEARAEFAQLKMAIDGPGGPAARWEAFRWGLITLDEALASLADEEILAMAEDIAETRPRFGGSRGGDVPISTRRFTTGAAAVQAGFSPPGGRYVGRVHAGVFLARGRVDDAATHYGRAVEVCERAGAWIEAARCRVGLAEIAAMRGDAAAARGLMAEAAGVFEKYGATLYLRNIASLRERYGLDGEASPPADADSSLRSE